MRRTVGLLMVLSLAGCSSGGCTSTHTEPELSTQSTYDFRRPAPPPAKTSWAQFDPANPSYFQSGSVAATGRAPAAGYDPRLAARTYTPPAPTAQEPPPPVTFAAAASAPAPVPPDHAMPTPSPADRGLPPPTFEVAYEDTRAIPAVAESSPKMPPPVYSSPRPAVQGRTADPDIGLTAAAMPDLKEASAAAPASPPTPVPMVSNPKKKAPTEPKPRPAAAEESSAEPAMPPENSSAMRLVNNKRISLNYKLDNVGTSGVSSVELWYTRDGRNWKKQVGRAQAKPPFVVEVAEEGLYGFTLMARNGMGIAKAPPQAGDQPQVWVTVDWTKPSVRLLGIEPGSDSKTGNIVIGWSASDKNLGPRPITLSYAEQAGGPWMPIIANAENTGRYVWQLPDKVPSRLFIRVEACDLAGNVGWAESKDPVVLDLAPPTISIVAVDGADQ